jgi:hypothetical protein
MEAEGMRSHLSVVRPAAWRGALKILPSSVQEGKAGPPAPAGVCGGREHGSAQRAPRHGR